MAEQNPAKTGGSFFTPKRILVIVLVLVSLVFIFSNLQQATLNLLGVHLTMPGWLWVLALILVGFIIGSMAPWLRPKKKK
ncbi:hypothetical protein [Glutamicibacter sp. NPDC087344]|uniref:hypothetical protein n=1 Tax=Glutamicibacter sp. NPDC087344 TaxID=3363994 RepID=UPI00381D04DD